MGIKRISYYYQKVGLPMENWNSHKIISNNPSPLSFNQFQVKISENHKLLGLILDTILKFNEHLEDKINKRNRIIGSIKKSYL